jgi:hypothetical protein
MSSEAAALPDRRLDGNVEGARRAALRLAFGVTACFAVVEAIDSDATFLAPLLAANMLVKLPRPPSLGQALGIIVLIALSTGAVLALTTMVISKPAVLLLTLALVIYLSFYAHWRGAPELATLLLQMSVVTIPVIAVVSPEGAGGFATTLLLAAIVALMAVWAAHAAFPLLPSMPADAAPGPSAKPAAEPRVAARHALLDTIVLVPALVWFILDATQVAVVVLIIILTLLRLHDRERGHQAALGLILGNLIGGVAAAVVYNLVLLGNTFLFFVTVVLAAALFFAGRIAIAGDRSPVYVVAFATFILLLGIGLSPLPGGSGEAFMSRLINVLLASAYAMGGLSLVERWRFRQ